MNWANFLAKHAVYLLWQAALLFCSAFFSGTETSLFHLSVGQLYRLRHGGRGGRMVAALMRRPHRTLNTLLLGNMLTNVAYSGLAGVMILSVRRSGGGAISVIIASVVPLLLLILIGEVVPKMLAMAGGARLATIVAAPLAIFERIVMPVLWLLEHILIRPITSMITPRKVIAPAVTGEELSSLLDLSAKQGRIKADENALIQEIMDLTDLRVSDIMVPRVDIIAYDADDSPAGLIELFRKTHLKKIPVYEGSIDRILGVVHAKRLLLERPTSLRSLVVAVPFVPESATAEKLLLQFRVTKTQLAIVVDEFGGLTGLVTLQDVLEEIVGKLPDPHEPRSAPAVEKIAPDEYLVTGTLPMHEWIDVFKMDLSSKRINTVGGFVLSLLGRIPQQGDRVQYHNIEFTVDSMLGRRIDKLRVHLLGEDRKR